VFASRLSSSQNKEQAMADNGGGSRNRAPQDGGEGRRSRHKKPRLEQSPRHREAAHFLAGKKWTAAEDIEQQDIFRIPAGGSLMERSIDMAWQLQIQLESGPGDDDANDLKSDCDADDVPQTSTRETSTRKIVVDATRSFLTQMKDERKDTCLSVVVLGESGAGKSTLINSAVQVCIVCFLKSRPVDVSHTFTLVYEPASDTNLSVCTRTHTHISRFYLACFVMRRGAGGNYSE